MFLISLLSLKGSQPTPAPCFPGHDVFWVVLAILCHFFPLPAFFPKRMAFNRLQHPFFVSESDPLTAKTLLNVFIFFVLVIATHLSISSHSWHDSHSLWEDVPSCLCRRSPHAWSPSKRSESSFCSGVCHTPWLIINSLKCSHCFVFFHITLF